MFDEKMFVREFSRKDRIVRFVAKLRRARAERLFWAGKGPEWH